MVIGRVMEWMGRLKKGEQVILTIDDLRDSARAYTSSGIFDYVSPEYINMVVNEVQSDEYQEFELRENLDGRSWTLRNSECPVIERIKN